MNAGVVFRTTRTCSCSLSQPANVGVGSELPSNVFHEFDVWCRSRVRVPKEQPSNHGCWFLSRSSLMKLFQEARSVPSTSPGGNVLTRCWRRCWSRCRRRSGRCGHAGGSGYEMPHDMGVRERQSFCYKRTLEPLPTARSMSLKAREGLVENITAL